MNSFDKDKIFLQFSNEKKSDSNINLNEKITKGERYFRQLFKKAFGKNFSTSLGYTYTNTKQTQPGVVKRNAGGYLPKHAINLGLSYNSKKFDADLMARASLDRKGADEGLFPNKDYVIVDLAVNYKPIKELKAYIKVNNLFDKYYAEYSNVAYSGPGDWYSMPGRSIVGGIEYSF